MRALPEGLIAYRTTREFTHETAPAGLLREHTTREGSWALIRVHEGALRYRILGDAPEEHLLTPAVRGVVWPQQPHEVEPVGAVRFAVELWRRPTLRVGRAEDLDAILAIVAETVEDMRGYGNDQWDATYPTREDFARDVARGTLHLVEDGGEVLGFIVVDEERPAAYDALTWPTPGSCLVIHRFAVARAARHRGVASALEGHATRLAREGGHTHVEVDTHSSNAGMQALLEHRGYARVGEVFMNGKARPFVCYEKPL